MEVKKMLSEILTKKDISQKELADLIKVSPGQISHYLSGDNYPRRRTLARIEKIYDELGENKFPPNATFCFDEASMIINKQEEKK